MRCFIYWRYFSYAAATAAASNDSYFIDNQELQLNSDSKVGSNSGFIIYESLGPLKGYSS